MRMLITQTESVRAHFAESSEYVGISDPALYKLTQSVLVERVDPKSIIPPKHPWAAFHETTERTKHPEAAAQARVWVLGYIDPRVMTELVTIGRTWTVYVSVKSWIDVRLLQVRAYHEGMPIREFVRRCWAWGWDPRVIDPFLPTGLEERLKLDQQGHDLLVDEFVCLRCGSMSREEVPRLCACGFDYRPTQASVVSIHGNTYCGES